MIKVLFICHGNICRSPMAELILKKMVKDAGKEKEFVIASAATSNEEIGNPVYPPARRKLNEHGISCEGKHAVQLKKSDYDKYDYIIAMEDYNIKNIFKIIKQDPNSKVHKLLDFTDSPKDIDDPWYTGDFDTSYKEIEEGCRAFLDRVL